MDVPEPRQPIEVICTRCRRGQALPLFAHPDPAVETPVGDWHQTKMGWVCGDCWADVDRRREQELCRLCGRDARPEEDKHEEWRARDEWGDLLCPECHIAGEDSVKVQLMKDVVRRWQQAGEFPRGYQALIDGALERERMIVMALLRSRLERQGASPTEDDWTRMVSRAVETARAAWPEPVGQQKAN